MQLPIRIYPILKDKFRVNVTDTCSRSSNPVILLLKSGATWWLVDNFMPLPLNSCKERLSTLNGTLSGTQMRSVRFGEEISLSLLPE